MEEYKLLCYKIISNKRSYISKEQPGLFLSIGNYWEITEVTILHDYYENKDYGKSLGITFQANDQKYLLIVFKDNVICVLYKINGDAWYKKLIFRSEDICLNDNKQLYSILSTNSSQ